MTDKNIIERLKKIHAEWDKQGPTYGGGFFGSCCAGTRADIYERCADELAEVIKELEKE